MSAGSPAACGLLPLQLGEGGGTLSPPSTSCPPWEDEHVRGLLVRWGLLSAGAAAQSGHSSSRGVRLWKGETQVAPKPRERLGGAGGC